MSIIWFVLAFAFSTSVSQDEPLDFSCATFHAFLTESELIARYGHENVTPGPVFGTDDGPSEGTILFANQSDTRVEITWRDAAAKQNPSWIRVRGERSRWRTPNRLATGDDLLTIERRNGWPFRLAGFSSEGGHGDLRNWERGRLGNLPNCNIGITFQPRSPIEDPLLIRQVTSLSQVSSGHPAMQKINPKSGCALDQASPPANSRKYRRRDTRCARMGYPYADRSGTVLCRFTCGGPAVSAAGISLSAEESGAVGPRHGDGLCRTSRLRDAVGGEFQRSECPSSCPVLRHAASALL